MFEVFYKGATMSKEYYRYAISILAFKDNVLMVEATSEKDAKKKAKKFINIIADKDR